jgi:prepilin-type N-terminal cleavage/methylation domain-containing protein
MKNKGGNQSGFTLVELLVSILLLSFTLIMLIGYVLGLQRAFLNDVVRTRINSNLRTALDIMAMNIRQAGENLGATFPAVELSTDNDNVGQKITLRRNRIAEVLTLCENATAGATTVYISTTTTPSPACVYSNVTSLYNSFRSERVANDNLIKLWIYNSTTRVGQYIDYTEEGTSSGKYFLTVEALPAAFTAGTTYLYYIEEYEFSLDEATDTLNLTRNSDSETLEPVAFSVSDMNISVLLQNSSSVTSLPPAGANTWKDMSYVTVTLTGSEVRKSQTYSTTISGNYYPRNVLSR